VEKLWKTIPLTQALAIVYLLLRPMSSFKPLAALLAMNCAQCWSQVTNAALRQKLDQLLSNYGTYKRYADTNPARVESTLYVDRRRVFHAIITGLVHGSSPKRRQGA